MDAKTDLIRVMNDELRHTLTGGIALITPGIAALGTRCRRPHLQDHHCV